MTDHDHIDVLKNAADPQRVAVALGLHSRGGALLLSTMPAARGEDA